MTVFLHNKYSKWYFNIISAAQVRIEELSYSEKHHILPKSLGGKNNKENLVILTAREHFICHQLLIKMVSTTKHKYQMWNAFSCMLYRKNSSQQRYQISSRKFEIIKQAGSQIKSERFSGKNNPMYGKRGDLSPHYGKIWTDEHRKNASESHKGKLRTEEARAKQSASTKGRKQTAEHIEKRKCVGSKNGRFGYKMTPEEIAQRTASTKRNRLLKTQGELKFLV
jgi:hypothetical protein